MSKSSIIIKRINSWQSENKKQAHQQTGRNGGKEGGREGREEFLKETDETMIKKP